MKKKIIGVSMVFVVLAMLCAQSVAAQTIIRDAWTDKLYYDPGQKGKLLIELLNELDDPVEVYNITIEYPWLRIEEGEWVGNETIKIEPAAIMSSKGGYYSTSVDFTVPNDGGASGGPIYVDIWTSDGEKSTVASISVTGSGGVMPVKAVGLDTLMTTAAVFLLICTIIIAIVIFLAAGRARGPRMMNISPSRSKAKAE